MPSAVRARVRPALRSVPCAAGLPVVLVFLGAAAAFAQPYHPAVEAFFASSDPFIRGTVLPNIEKHRKSSARIAFTGEDGRPLPGLAVSVRQMEHAFLWGAVPTFERSPATPPERVKLWRDIYNFGIPEYTFKWSNVEKVRGAYDWSTIDRILETMRASGAQVEYHFLTGYHPAWLEGLDTAAKAQAQRAYALAALDRYKDRIKYYQVYNEAHYPPSGGPFRPIPRAAVFFDQTAFFREIAARYPGLVLGINDCFRWHIRTLPTPAQAKARYPGIRFVGQHGHNPHTYWVTPEEIYGHYDPYAGSGVNIHVEEFGIREGTIQGGGAGAWDEEKKVRYFISTYATLFSHPAVGAFNQWGMGPDTNPFPGSFILDPEGRPKPSYAALKSLIRDKFMTRLDGAADGTGLFEFRGFRGAYEVTVRKGGSEGRARIDLGDTDAHLELRVLEDASGLAIQGGVPVTLAPLLRRPGKPVPAIRAEAGMPVLFSGLREVRDLEIADLRGRLIKAWRVIGDRIHWDRTDSMGRPAPRGAYVVTAYRPGRAPHASRLDLR